jgi:hypothetical protein
MENEEKKPYSKPPPPAVKITVLVYEPPCQFDGCGWEGYHIVPLDKCTKVLLVCSQGQEIRFVPGQGEVSDDIYIGGDSSKQSPRAGD